MATELELAVLLSTYERPKHLERSLASLALQRNMTGRFEVVVCDDGSQDRTSEVVRRFASAVDFPLRMTTHPHRGFRVALCRNDGVRATTAPYLLFSDSDCIFPPDHLADHLRARQPNVVRAGNSLRLSQELTDRLDLPGIASGAYCNGVSRLDRLQIYLEWVKEKCYQIAKHPSKPKLTGWNIGISRADLEVVNGFDESFVGWGCEDDDLAYRLRKAGKRIVSALGYTYAYHMWHPSDPTTPVKWNHGPNVERLQVWGRPIRCEKGLATTINVADCTSNNAADEVSHRVPGSAKQAA